ncbi:MAG: PAS domain S-box protein, partial [Halobaculum sp.]
ELERTNEELETLNTRFQLALEATDTGVWEWDLTTDAIACDETTERLFGFESGAFPGTPGDILDRVHDDDVSAVEDAVDTAVEDAVDTAVEDAVDTGPTYSVEFRVQVPDGDQRWVLARGVVEQDESGEPSRILGVQTDITDRKESQQAVEQARRQLRQIVDLVPDPLYVKNRDDEVLLSNEANAELHGLTPDETEGRREREIESTVENIENFDPYRQREMEVIESGSPATFQEELTGPDGRRYVFQTTRIPFETADGDEDAVLGYARDVTELKVYEQELEATKQTLAASNEKLEQTNDDLETLNRILRHDVRNDAVVLARFGRKLEQHVDEDGREHLQQLLQRAEHIRDLTTGLRDLMQTTLEDQRNLRPIRLDTVLEAQIRDVSDAYENAVVTVAGDLPQVSVRADRMLASVFGNVLQNAVQHNDSDVPKVTVSVEEREHRTEVRISDNGPGIPDDIADDIFGKGEHGLESKGTGIGLYLVSQLLEAYGGDIRLADDTRRDTPDD